MSKHTRRTDRAEARESKAWRGAQVKSIKAFSDLDRRRDEMYNEKHTKKKEF